MERRPDGGRAIRVAPLPQQLMTLGRTERGEVAKRRTDRGRRRRAAAARRGGLAATRPVAAMAPSSAASWQRARSTGGAAWRPASKASRRCRRSPRIAATRLSG
jgi:hypothetical protein